MLQSTVLSVSVMGPEPSETARVILGPVDFMRWPSDSYLVSWTQLCAWCGDVCRTLCSGVDCPLYPDTHPVACSVSTMTMAQLKGLVSGGGL